MRIVRWTAALPAGIISAAALHLLLTVAFSIGHGFQTIESFWAAPDMNGMPISGTYILLVTRAATAATLVGITAYVVPSFQKLIGNALAGIVCVGSFALLAYLSWLSFRSGLSITIGEWYRNLVELLSIVAGSVVGAAVGTGSVQRDGGH